MKRLLLVFILLLAPLIIPSVVAEEGGYCKITANEVSYWLFEDPDEGGAVCNMLRDVFGLDAVWFGFDEFNQQSIEDNSDFCDGWAGECEEDFGNIINSGGSSGRNRNRYVCVDNWECTEWGPCADGVQFRSCVDLMRCGNFYDSPDESRTCNVVGDNTVLLSGENDNLDDNSEGITGAVVGRGLRGIGTTGTIIVGIIVALVIAGSAVVFLIRR